MLTLDTERSSPAEIRRAIKILVSLEESADEIRDIIKSLYDVLAGRVNEERRVYRAMVRKEKAEVRKEESKPGFVKSRGMFQGEETGY